MHRRCITLVYLRWSSWMCFLNLESTAFMRWPDLPPVASLNSNSSITCLKLRGRGRERLLKHLLPTAIILQSQRLCIVLLLPLFNMCLSCHDTVQTPPTQHITCHVIVPTPVQVPSTAPRGSYETASGSQHETAGRGWTYNSGEIYVYTLYGQVKKVVSPHEKSRCSCHCIQSCS